MTASHIHFSDLFAFVTAIIILLYLCREEKVDIRVNLVKPYTKESLLTLYIYLFITVALQCFDTVGWAAGRASGL